MNIVDIYKKSWNFIKNNLKGVALFTLLLALTNYTFIQILSTNGTLRHLLYLFGMLIVVPITTSLVQIELYNDYKKDKKVEFEGLFKYFRNNNFEEFAIFVTKMSLEIFLYSLLVVIPGIYKSIAYSRAIYIKRKNPTMSYREVLNQSEKEMYGYKGKLFLAQLILGIVTYLTIGLPLINAIRTLIYGIQMTLFEFLGSVGLTSILIIIVLFAVSIFGTVLIPIFQAERDNLKTIKKE